MFFKTYLSDLKQEFTDYNKQKLGKDLMAGLTVTAVALPLALAFGVSSGADAASGLITAIIGGILMSILAGGFYQISGPTGAMAAILLSLVAREGLEIVFLAGALAGVILILAGIFHLGKLTSFIPMPVITGFTTGIAVIIVLGQIDNFFGTTSSGDTNIETIASYCQNGFTPDLTTTLIGIGVVVFMLVFPKKWSSVVPASLLAIILATAVCMIGSIDVAVVGEIPTTLLPDVRLTFSVFSLDNLAVAISPAISIALLGMIESLLCGASAGRMTGVRLKSDRELVAQGIGNLVVPFFGGVPATAAIARTSVAVKSGAQTRLTGIVHGIGLLISMLILAPVMSNIPMAALAGVLMVTAWRMNEWDAIKQFFGGRFKSAIAKFLVTMVCTIIFDLTIAIAAGVGLALVLLVSHLSNLEISYDRVDMTRLGETDHALRRRYKNTTVAYVNGPIMFANTNTLEQIADHLEGSDTLLLSMRGVSMMDLSAGQTMAEMIEQLQADGVDVMFCGISASVYAMMERVKITEQVGEHSFYWSATQALADLHPRNDGLTVKSEA